jgi:hypothetical protein
LTALSPTLVRYDFVDNSTNETGFNIERSTSASGPFMGVDFVFGSAVTGPVTQVDTTAQPNTTYYYRVAAVNGSGKSAYAGPVSVTTPAVVVTGASISGTVFNDQNFDGIQNNGGSQGTPDMGVAGRQVYLDIYGLGRLIDGDPISTTDANGNYSFTGLAAKNYLVRLVPVAGSVISAPVFGGKFFVPLGANQAVTGDDFGTHDVSTETTITLPDGRVLVGDIIYSNNPFAIPSQIVLRRFNADGSLDVNYGHLGSVVLYNDSFPTTLRVLFITPGADGSALIGTSRLGGQNSRLDQAVYLVSPAGAVVNASVILSGDSHQDAQLLSNALILANGKIIAYGYFQDSGTNPIAIEVRQFNGDLTGGWTTFQNTTGRPTSVTQLANGNVVVGLVNDATSATDTLTISAAGVIDPNRVIPGPTGLTATKSGANVQLQFNDNSANEQSFLVTRSSDIFHHGTPIGSVAGTVGTGVRTFTDTTAIAGKTYYYAVSAVNGLVRSNEATTTFMV